jgi:hypothetical protein
MALDPAIRNRIVKNALLSLFIYALPVVALFVYLRTTGERPWKDKNIKPYFGQIEKLKQKNQSL